MIAPAPTTLSITDGRLGRAKAPAVGGMAFQMTTMETRAAPDVAGMYVPFSAFFIHDYIVMDLHRLWYEYFRIERLACDLVICHLHTLDNKVVVRGWCLREAGCLGCSNYSMLVCNLLVTRWIQKGVIE